MIPAAYSATGCQKMGEMYVNRKLEHVCDGLQRKENGSDPESVLGAESMTMDSTVFVGLRGVAKESGPPLVGHGGDGGSGRG